MTKRSIAGGMTAALIAAAVAGCTQQQPPQLTAIPMAAAYPASAQQKMQAAHHWEVLAREIAGQVGPSAKSAGRQVYVAPNTPPSPFNQGFHGMLVEALVNEGVSVAAAPAGALTLTYNVQVVQHAAQRAGFAGPASDPPTASEAIVSAQIVDAGRVAFRTNRVFYVNSEDALAQYPSGRPMIATTARPVRVTQ